MSTDENAIVSGSLTAAAERINTRSTTASPRLAPVRNVSRLAPVRNAVVPASNNQNVESDLSNAIVSGSLAAAAPIINT